MSFDTRAARIWNCVSIASAFVVMYFTNDLHTILATPLSTNPLAWGFVILLATLFTCSALLEVISWLDPIE
jgi:hypothetical protein